MLRFSLDKYMAARFDTMPRFRYAFIADDATLLRHFDMLMLRLLPDIRFFFFSPPRRAA